MIILMLALLSPTLSYAAGDRDILWNIVSNCLDPAAVNYDKICRWPLENSSAACRNSTSIWEKNRDFVILRDRKMCNCLDNRDFVHGLAIPLQKVTGSEDPARPAAIWQFAWEHAVRRIGQEAEVALVANPPGVGNRSQDQLHVHLVRLNDAGKRLVSLDGMASVATLDKVWDKAVELAEGRFNNWGVLVAKKPSGGYLVLVDDRNLEHAYTVSRCP
jgi:CDP-diacylglycerol pyrophosphatase